jgi:hypothetical protein
MKSVREQSDYVMMNPKGGDCLILEKIQEALQLNSFLLDLFHNNYLRRMSFSLQSCRLCTQLPACMSNW